MSRGWHAPYPLFVLSGTDDFMRDRELSKARRAAVKSGRRVVLLSEGDSEGLSAAMSASDFMVDRSLIILYADTSGRKKLAWTDADAKLLISHHTLENKNADVDAAVVVSSSAAAPAKGSDGFSSSLIAAVGRSRHLTWEAPKPWAEQEVAAKYLQAEVARLGSSMTEDLAQLMVRTCGSDRWLVTQEALKLVTYLRAVDRAEGPATRADVAAVVAPFAGGVLEDLVGAVAMGDAGMTSKMVVRLRDDGPPVAICAALASNVTRWLHAASSLRAEGVSEDDVASRIGMNAYVFKANVAPHAKRWGVRHLTMLLRDIAAVERASKQGRIDPWIMLESALLRHSARLVK